MRASHGYGELADLGSVMVLPSGRPSATPGGEVGDMSGADLVPADLLHVWEEVYREYLATSQLMDNGDVGKREMLARLSAQVAVTWRRMADTVPGSRWWLQAALLTAAEAMEHQARDWSGRRGWSR